MIYLNEDTKKSSFKNNKIKNSFITSEKSNNLITFNISQRKELSNITRRKIQRAKTNRALKQRSSETEFLENNNNLNDEFKSDNYEDLFFFFLLHIGKIDYFEKILIDKKERRITNSYFFMNIYDTLTGDKIVWDNFYFPKYIFKLFYIKSRKLQKEIFKYSLLKGKEIMEVINSYNRKYTSNKKIKNWSIKPAEAFLNYEKINQSKNTEIEKSNKRTLSKITNFTDFIIRTNNKGKGKTLIFLGKTINIYIDDIDKNQDKNNGLSMATEESEFKKKVKNEIIYTFDDVAIKAKKKNLTINNIKHNNSKTINLNLSKNKYKKISKNMIQTSKNKFKFKNRIININKNEIEKNIFNNFPNDKNKFPIINLPKLKSRENSELKEYKTRNKEKSFFELKKNKETLKKKEDRKNKIKFNSFRIFNDSNKIKENKTIINFFTKRNKDFYY